jgi:hypothetical protein
MSSRPQPGAEPTGAARGAPGCAREIASHDPRGNGAQPGDDLARFVEPHQPAIALRHPQRGSPPAYARRGFDRRSS